MQTKQIKLTRISGAVDSLDHERGTIKGTAGSVALECHGMSVQQALDLAQAAPDLLEALEALYEHEGEIETNGIGMESDSEALEAAKALARAAIDKAEGRD